MAITLQGVVPFGRSLDVYRRIFDLSDRDIERKIIGVGDGPSSFNAEMRKIGKHVTSVDPLYEFTAEEIGGRFNVVLDGVIDQVKASVNGYVWTYYKSADDLRRQRMEAMEIFLRDYADGLREGRYVKGALPRLGFGDREFDIALCSHFLFLYSEHFDHAFHRDSVYEMLRVAHEARIFPLIDLKLRPSPYVELIIDELERDGYCAEIKKVDYEVQRGGNMMMRIYRA